jgi:hypothetical protein
MFWTSIAILIASNTIKDIGDENEEKMADRDVPWPCGNLIGVVQFTAKRVSAPSYKHICAATFPNARGYA